VGLILFLVWRNQTPLRARSAGKGALISTLISAGLTVVGIVVMFLVLS